MCVCISAREHSPRIVSRVFGASVVGRDGTRFPPVAMKG